jgi:hypothetical protein
MKNTIIVNQSEPGDVTRRFEASDESLQMLIDRTAKDLVAAWPGDVGKLSMITIDISVSMYAVTRKIDLVTSPATGELK